MSSGTNSGNQGKTTISVCKKTRRSSWEGTKAPRNTDTGMKMTVYVEGTGSKRKSRTVFEKA